MLRKLIYSKTSTANYTETTRNSTYLWKKSTVFGWGAFCLRWARVTRIQQVCTTVVQFCWQIPCTSQFIFFICHVTAPWFRELFLFITRLWSITTNFSFTIYYFEERQGTGHCFSNCYSTKIKQYFSKGYSKLNSTLYIKIYHYECNSKLAGYSFTPQYIPSWHLCYQKWELTPISFSCFFEWKGLIVKEVDKKKTSTVSKIKIFHCVCLGVAINLNWFFLPLSWNSDSYTARPSYLFVYEASCFGDFLPCEKGNREEQTITRDKKFHSSRKKKSPGLSRTGLNLLQIPSHSLLLVCNWSTAILTFL